MGIHQTMATVSAAQHGLFTTAQAVELGTYQRSLGRAARRGDLRRLSASVWAVPGSPDTARQRLLACILEIGSPTMVSFDTALALWGLPGFRVEPFHIVTSRDRKHRTGLPGATVHTSTLILPRHLTRVDGIPIATPTRAIFDESWYVHPAKLERTIDTAWARRLTSGRLLHRMFDELRRRGRPLIASMRRLLEDRPVDYVPAESGLESRVAQICRDHGLANLRRQVDSGDDETWLGRMDFRDPEVPLVIQVDSETFHDALVDQRADTRQQEALERSGYVVCRLREFDVWQRPAEVARTIREARRSAAQHAPRHATRTRAS